MKDKKKGKINFILMIVFFILAMVLMYGFSFLVTSGKAESLVAILPMIAVVVVLFIVSLIMGYRAHNNVDKNGKAWEKAAYILTFMPFAISNMLIGIWEGLFSKISDRSTVNVKAPKSDRKDSGNIIIQYKGRGIELYFIERSTYYFYKRPGELSGTADHPYYGKSYLWYGTASNHGSPFWMSFDEGKTFVREDDFNPYTYKG